MEIRWNGYILKGLIHGLDVAGYRFGWGCTTITVNESFLNEVLDHCHAWSIEAEVRWFILKRCPSFCQTLPLFLWGEWFWFLCWSLGVGQFEPLYTRCDSRASKNTLLLNKENVSLGILSFTPWSQGAASRSF